MKKEAETKCPKCEYWRKSIGGCEYILKMRKRRVVDSEGNCLSFKKRKREHKSEVA